MKLINPIVSLLVSSMVSSMIVFFASVSAVATPTVGDQARFDIKIEQNGAYVLGQYEIQLLAKDSAGNYQLRTVLTMEDESPRVEETTETEKAFVSDATIKTALENCSTYGGTNSQYTMTEEGHSLTVPTCIIPMVDDQENPAGEIHIAKVAFGFVKQVQIEASTGRTLTFEMKAFTNGK